MGTSVKKRTRAPNTATSSDGFLRFNAPSAVAGPSTYASSGRRSTIASFLFTPGPTVPWRCIDSASDMVPATVRVLAAEDLGPFYTSERRGGVERRQVELKGVEVCRD